MWCMNQQQQQRTKMCVIKHRDPFHSLYLYCLLLALFVHLDEGNPCGEDPLDDGGREHKDVEGEGEPEVVADLPIEAHEGDKGDKGGGLGSIRVEGLVNVTTLLGEDDGVRHKHIRTAHSGVEASDEALNHPGKHAAQEAEDVSAGNGGPLGEVIGEEGTHGRLEVLAAMAVADLSEGAAQGNCLGEVHTEGGDDGEETHPDGGKGLGDLVGLDGTEEEIDLAGKELLLADLQHIGNTIVIVIDKIVALRGLVGCIVVFNEDLKGGKHALPNDEADALNGSNKGEVRSTEEADNEAKDKGTELGGVIGLELLPVLLSRKVRTTHVGVRIVE